MIVLLFLFHVLSSFSWFSGILIGTLTMELGGVITINCEKTGYKAEIEFKLKVRRSRVSVSGAPMSKKFGSKPLQSLCCVLRQDTLLYEYLSPLRSVCKDKWTVRKLYRGKTLMEWDSIRGKEQYCSSCRMRYQTQQLTLPSKWNHTFVVVLAILEEEWGI